MASPVSGPAGPTNLGVAPNVGGLLCYAPCCIGLIFSIVAVIVEKQSRFVRFHAFQSLLLQGVAFVLSMVLQLATVALGFIDMGIIGLLVSLLGMVIGFGLLIITILMMIKAYNGEEYELPTLGQMARRWV